MQTAGVGIMAKRSGFAFGDNITSALRSEFQDRLQAALTKIMKAEQWIVLYEILALMPATGLITLGRMGF